ncbi:uncharacterized protein LOC131482035 isoform X2 [Ochotona princeps]|uniref:uncharacterized protein LOC131482035 isoform X2 n=1 Tax=Ochotona princeps TaxID=9978 RepID=UPI002714BA11|nr:uncharacterized protein LOC131482035 isoform X2 [Ochotona princeps]
MYSTWAFHPPLPGYEFGDIIGQGGYGVVKLARQLATGRDVAVKIFLQERRASSSRSVAREASLMRSLQHPHILQLLEEQQQGSDSVCFSPSCSTASLSSQPSGQLQQEQSSLSSASHEPVPEASCSMASTSSPTDLAQPEVEAPREPESTGSPIPAKEGKRGFRGVCRSFLRFLQRACCIRQDPDRGPGLRSRKVAPEDSAQSKLR